MSQPYAEPIKVNGGHAKHVPSPQHEAPSPKILVSQDTLAHIHDNANGLEAASVRGVGMGVEAPVLASVGEGSTRLEYIRLLASKSSEVVDVHALHAHPARDLGGDGLVDEQLR